jgi:hypothetical protein
MNLRDFLSQDKKPAAADENRESDEVPEVNSAIGEQEREQNEWDSLRSRTSRYYIKTEEFPEWCEEEETLAFLSCSMSGQVVHSKKDPSKVKFRVHRDFRGRGMEEMISDAVDFEKEDEAIDFMLQEKKSLDFRADGNVVVIRHYFWSLKDGKPYRRYLCKFEGEFFHESHGCLPLMADIIAQPLPFCHSYLVRGSAGA